MCYRILRGQLPLQVKRRAWDRDYEAPVQIDVRDFVNDRLIFTAMVWPTLESPRETALHAQRERVEEVLATISAGAADRLWSMRYEIDDGLLWDRDRQVWYSIEDGFASDGGASLSAATRGATRGATRWGWRQGR